MDTAYLPAFDQAMQFLYEKHGNALSEDLVQAYCVQGYLSDEQGLLRLTDRGRAMLRRARQTAVNADGAGACAT